MYLHFKKHLHLIIIILILIVIALPCYNTEKPFAQIHESGKNHHPKATKNNKFATKFKYQNQPSLKRIPNLAEPQEMDFDLLDRKRRRTKKEKHSRLKEIKRRLQNFIKMKEAIRNSEEEGATVGPLKVEVEEKREPEEYDEVSELALKTLEKTVHRAIMDAEKILSKEGDTQGHIETRAWSDDEANHKQEAHLGSRHNANPHPEDAGEIGHPETAAHEKVHPETDVEKTNHKQNPSSKENKFSPLNNTYKNFEFDTSFLPNIEYKPQQKFTWNKWSAKSLDKAKDDIGLYKVNEMLYHDLDHGEKVHHPSLDADLGIESRAGKEMKPGQHPVAQVLPILEKLSEDLDEIKKEGIEAIYDSKNDFPCPINGLWTSPVAGVKIKLDTCNDGKVRARIAAKGVPHSQGALIGCDWRLAGLVPSKREAPFALAAICTEQNRIATFLGQCKTCENADKIFGNWMFTRISRDCNDLMAAQEIKPDVWHRDQIPELREYKLLDKLTEAMQPYDDSNEPTCKKLHKPPISHGPTCGHGHKREAEVELTLTEDGEDEDC